MLAAGENIGRDNAQISRGACRGTIRVGGDGPVIPLRIRAQVCQHESSACRSGSDRPLSGIAFVPLVGWAWSSDGETGQASAEQEIASLVGGLADEVRCGAGRARATAKTAGAVEHCHFVAGERAVVKGGFVHAAVEKL